MKIIGLTGGVGTGKSTVAAVLKEKYGAFVIMADEVGHFAMEKGCETYQQMVSLFGEEILDEKGEVDRRRLGDMVFPRPDKLQALNEIIHPFVRKTIEGLLKEAETEDVPFVVLESAILFESGYESLCDEIWLVTAKKEIRLERLKASRGYTKEKFEAIMARQMSEKEQKKRGCRIISNDGDRKALEKELKLLLED